MLNRHLFPCLLFLAALPLLSLSAQTTAGPDGFRFQVKEGISADVHLVWAGSSLEKMEIRAKPDGPVLQSIKIGEGETISCDLDRASLPPKWLGALDHNGDGFQDIYLQVAQGSSPSYAVLLYEPKGKQFAVSKTLAAVSGLDTSGGSKTMASKDGARKLADSFGLVTKGPNETPKLSISGPPLKKGDLVEIVPHDEQQTIYTAEIVEPVEPTDDSGGAMYTLEFMTRYDEAQPFLGIAVVGAIGGITTSNGKASAKLANAPAGSRLAFRVCTSGEGMHLTVWSGKPLTGKRVWHRYHYLGYDVEADCKPKDYQD